MKKRTVLIIIFILLIGVGGASAYFYDQNNSKKNETTQKESEKKDTEDEPQSPENTPNDEQPITEADQQKQDETSKPTDQPTGSVNISVAQDTGEMIIVRATVTQIKTGNCQLTLTKGSKIVKKSAPLGLVTNYYSCQGFNVPQSELGVGSWQVVVQIDNIKSQNMTLEVK